MLIKNFTSRVSCNHAYNFPPSAAANTTQLSTEPWYAIGGSGLFYPDAVLGAKDDTSNVDFRLGKEVTDNIDIQACFPYN